MPSLEKSERIVGAVFLGIPALDAFVWLLDTYARLELLVTLHDQLPHFLVSPITTFVCMCVGLGFLYFSDLEQLKRINNRNATQRIVDRTGTEIISEDKPRWLMPVGVVFLVALIATPLLAVGYTLAYGGAAPPPLALPKPQLIAYVKTPVPIKLTQRQPFILYAPAGINIRGNNSGSAIVNNFGGHKPLLLAVDQQNYVTAQLSSLKGQSVEIDVDNATPETDIFAKNLMSSLLLAQLNVHRTDSTFSGGCLKYPGVSFMVGINRTTAAESIWNALVGARAVEGEGQGCSRSGEPDELHIYIRPPG
jgi:hypothetical protein